VIFHQTTLAGAFLIEPELRGDERGFFARTMCRDEFEAHGLNADFVQQNMSVSLSQGTLRGLHYQRPPNAEAKLIRCVRGKIWDVIVDVRPESPRYLHQEGFELSDENHRMLYVPEGFAHGFQTLTRATEVNYLVTATYAPEAECGLRYDDPKLGIGWPLPVSSISPKDTSWPLLAGR
jgi:dTDP-4-dehydrorhamnose 3,5-epimerase